jgi:hypothetical protein
VLACCGYRLGSGTASRDAFRFAGGGRWPTQSSWDGAFRFEAESRNHWRRLQKQGEIESFEVYSLDPHGGDLSGFLVARGDPEKLSRIRDSEEFDRINERALMVVENFGVVGARTGAELERQFSAFGAVIQDLG